jgi:predicted nucleic acid-binding protein
VEDLGYWLVHSPTAEDVVEAIRLHRSARLAFWDAMILTSAGQLGCRTVWPEDWNAGQTTAGVKIQNPFA